MKLKIPAIDISVWLNPWKFLVLLILFASLIQLYIFNLARTPRSSLNVMQAVSILFFFILFMRHRGASEPELSIIRKENGAFQGMLPALALGAFIWSFCVPFSFISDDFAHIYHARGPMFHSLWESLFRGQAETFLRPVGFAGIFLDYRLWHQWAPGYHLTNLLIHLAGTAGLYLVCRSIHLKANTATSASLIFAVLPVNAESIAWMGARFDLLSTCLTIWAIVFYLRFRNTKHLRFYFWALVCFSLAVFSKENAYVLPLLLLSLECLIFSDLKLKPVAGFFCAAAVFFGYRWIVLGGIGGYANAAGESATFDIGIKTLAGLFIRAPAQTLLGFNWFEPSFSTVVIPASLTASALLIIALAARPGSVGFKRLLFCIAWIILPALPAHSLLFVGADLTNSRILYLGSAGAAILIAQLISGIGFSLVRRLSSVILTCLFCIAILLNLDAWRYASRLSQKLLFEITQLEPAPQPDTLYVFHNLPFTVRGVFYYQAGLREAIQMTYNREDLNALRNDEESSKTVSELNPGPVIHLVWREKGEFLLKRLEKGR
jgi:hypothetical protein